MIVSLKFSSCLIIGIVTLWTNMNDEAVAASSISRRLKRQFAFVNPCKSSTLRYHAHPANQLKYIQCTESGDMIVMDCAPGTVWNPGKASCTTMDEYKLDVQQIEPPTYVKSSSEEAYMAGKAGGLDVAVPKISSVNYADVIKPMPEDYGKYAVGNNVDVHPLPILPKSNNIYKIAEHLPGIIQGKYPTIPSNLDYVNSAMGISYPSIGLGSTYPLDLNPTILSKSAVVYPSTEVSGKSLGDYFMLGGHHSHYIPHHNWIYPWTSSIVGHSHILPINYAKSYSYPVGNYQPITTLPWTLPTSTSASMRKRRQDAGPEGITDDFSPDELESPEDLTDDMD